MILLFKDHLANKNLTQIWGIYKISSKKGFLDSMDLRETTLFKRETSYPESLSQLQRLRSRSGLYCSQVDAALESEQ